MLTTRGDREQRATSMARIQLSIIVSGLGRLFGDDLQALLEMAKVADAVGIDQIVFPDHLAIGPRTDRYPYGEFPLPPDEPWLEPLTTLAAIAGATSQIRLGTGILIAPLRPALLLAKAIGRWDPASCRDRGFGGPGGVDHRSCTRDVRPTGPRR